MKVLLFIAIAVIPSWQDWYCGNVFINSTKDCLCGDTIITIKDFIHEDASCCGNIQCVAEEDGRGLCVGGSVCKSEKQTWPCGDTLVSSEKICKCGEHSLPWFDFFFLISGVV